jgi:hypothetical protein
MSEHTTHGHGEHHHSEYHHGEYHPEAQHEENVIQLTPVIIFAVVMILVSVATFVTVKIIQHTFDINWERSEAKVSSLAQSPMPPTPMLQVSSGQDLIDLRAKEHAALTSYRWIDEKNGVVAIPVEQAITLLAQRGLASRDQAQAE